MRDHLTLDTNVCGKIAASRCGDTVLQFIRERYRPCVSINTVDELLDGICNSDDETRFVEHKRRFVVAMGGATFSKTKFLDYPIQQALQLAGAPTADVGKGAKRSHEYAECVLAAPTLYALRHSGVRIARRGVKAILRCGDVRANIQRGKDAYIQTMEFARAYPGGGAAAHREWAERIVHRYAPSVVLESITVRLVPTLDAAYVYQREVINLSISSGYNSQKHASDWLDWNQLIYLSDPTIHILTDDVRLRSRCSSSPQSSRVILLSEFLVKHALLL